MQIVKRTGETEPFNSDKIEAAIMRAMLEGNEVEPEIIDLVTMNILKYVQGMSEANELNVENIQDMVEQELMQAAPSTAKRYILFRDKRAKERNEGWAMNEMQYAIWDKKYRYGSETFDQWLERVSAGNAQIKKRMRKKQFLFGGRILANRGLHKQGRKVTYSNCYVMTPPADNIEAIFDTMRNMARTYSYGGGCGISLRDIRPRDAAVHNNARTTSGAVSFMPLYSLTTETIGQNGRRGALMISIPSNHPDLEEFIDVKTQQGAVTGANISIEIDNAFMFAVRDRQPYRLHFTVEDTGEVMEKWVDASELYAKIVKNNWDWAEPGMLYWDRISNYHLMSNTPGFYFAGTNPCAEEPLPPGGSCLLGSINLSEFVVAPFTEQAGFDFPEFERAVKDATTALNEVLDEGLPLHPLEEQRLTVEKLRQIGLGVFGIYQMFIKMGITYGSTKSMYLSEIIAHILLNAAAQQSAVIAGEKGSFDDYNYDYVSDSAFFQENFTPETKSMIKRLGLRNSQLLCIAPTGSLSSMLGVSGGIEPEFSLSFNRTTKSLHGKDVTYKVNAAIVQEYLDANGLDKDAELPEMFVTAMNLDWRNRIEMQAVWQKYIDASISSTVNLPKETTVEETQDLYMYAWEMGLKGCTIFRDGCKRLGILTLDEPESEEADTPAEEPFLVTRGFYSKCPECESKEMVRANGCITCQECGFSPC